MFIYFWLPPRAIKLKITKKVANSQECSLFDCYHLKQISHSRHHFPFPLFPNDNFHCFQWHLWWWRFLTWKGRNICVIYLWSLLWNPFSNVAQKFLSKAFVILNKTILLSKMVFFFIKKFSVPAMHENKNILQTLWQDEINMICWMLNDLKHTITLTD